MFNKQTQTKTVQVEKEVVTGFQVEFQARIRNGVVHCQKATGNGDYAKFDLPAFFVPAVREVLEGNGTNAKSLAHTGTDYQTFRLTLDATEIGAEPIEDESDEDSDDSDDDDEDNAPVFGFALTGW